MIWLICITVIAFIVWLYFARTDDSGSKLGDEDMSDWIC